MSVYNHADKSLYATLRKNARAAVLDSVTVCKAYLRVRLHSQSPQWWTAGPAGRHALGLALLRVAGQRPLPSGWP